MPEVVSSNTALAAYNADRRKEDTGRFCHAPFNNLFFGNRGYVMACCFNKLYVIGRYPEQSITQIWKGHKANELREAIDNFDLSKGCQGCASLLENGNFGGTPARVYDNHLHNGNYPKRMEFELDNTCNLECVMCTGEFSSSIRERRDKLPAIQSPYDDAFLIQLEEYIPHLETAQFLGGEPFLIPVYFGIWEKMVELNPSIRISIQTNGTILNSRVKKLLENLTVSISVSIDSLDKDTYPTIRVNGDLERVLSNIDFFSDYVKRKGTGFSFSFCPMQQNWKDIPAMVEFSNKHNAFVFFNTVFSPANCSLMSLSADKLGEIVSYLEGFKFPSSTQTEANNKRRYDDVLNEIKSYQQKALSMSKAGEQQLSFDEYMLNFKEFIEAQQSLSAEQKSSTYLSIKGKLQTILDKANSEGLLTAAEKGLVQQSPTVLYQALKEMDDMERVYLLFKERVLKLI